MTTTGTATFNLDVNELLEEAFERAGAEMRSGYDFLTARRSLNLLSIEWANRGINLWTVAEGSVPMVRGQVSYDIPVDTIDLMQHVIRTGVSMNQQDLNISRISADTYSYIPNKLTLGRPIQVWVDRQSGATNPATAPPPPLVVQSPRIHVWPVPDRDNYYTFVYWRLRRIQDVGNGTGTQDIPFRFLPAMVAGLAYYIALKIPEGVARIDMLKAMYDEQWQLAAEEDREKASLHVPPRIYPV